MARNDNQPKGIEAQTMRGRVGFLLAGKTGAITRGR